MKTIAVRLYTFSELSDSAKDNARSWARGVREYAWSGEAIDSLRAFATWFGVGIKDYSLGGSDNRSQGVSWELTFDDDICDLRGVRLWKWFNNQFSMPSLDGSCPFTGYCFDETLLDCIREFMQRPRDITLRELIRDCIEAFCRGYAADVDWTYSDEGVDDWLAGNEFDFREDGTIWS